MTSETTHPGGWVNGIGWVALDTDLPPDTLVRYFAADDPQEVEDDARIGGMGATPVIVTRWADGTAPTEPAPTGLEPGEIVAPRFYAVREQAAGEVLPMFYVVDSAGMGRIFLGRGYAAEALARQIGLRPIQNGDPR